MSRVPTAGIHHVSSIAGDPQRNLHFYSGVLGLRLVKVTVNFDDPGSYHLYYGDGSGRPGSILTSFIWGRTAAGGRVGIGQAAVISLSVVPTAVAFWVGRFIAQGVAFEGPSTRFGEQVLGFRDPDGIQLEVIGHPSADAREGWPAAQIPAESAIRGIHGVTLLEAEVEPTSRVLTQVLGLAPTRSEEHRFRFEAAGVTGRVVDLRAVGEFWGGAMGVGTVHHVAFRAPSPEAQLEVRAEVESIGLEVTPVLDRKYFQSIYYEEPGGVLFETATEEPGFTVDEPLEALGGRLQLPPWLESDRPAIERRLPLVHWPDPSTFNP